MPDREDLSLWQVILCAFIVAARLGWSNGLLGLSVAATATIAIVITILILKREVFLFRLDRLTIPSWMLLTYMVLIFFPSISIFTAKTGGARYIFIAAVQATPVLFAIGILTANRLLNSYKSETEDFFTREISLQEPSRLRPGLVIMLALSLILVVVYLTQVPTIPLFHLLSGRKSFDSMMVMREESFKLLNSRLIYLFVWLRGTIFPLLILITGGNYWLHKKRFWLAAFVCSSVFGIGFISLSTERAPVAIVFVMLFFLLYLAKNGRANLSQILIFAAFALAFPMAVYALLGNSALAVISTVENRVFYVPAYTLYHYFEIFPAKVGFLWGLSIDKLALLLGRKAFPLTGYVSDYMYPGNSLKTATANAAFVGDMWANFGVAGVVLGGWLVGLIFQTIHIFLIRKEKNIVNLSVYAFFLNLVWMLSSTSLFVVILTNGLLVALAVRAALDGKRVVLIKMGPQPEVAPHRAGAEFE